MPDEGGAGMTDQEQTERGASTVDRVQATSDRLYKADFFGRLYLADYVAEVQTLCADLERVTAKRENVKSALRVAIDWNNSLEARLVQAEAERDAMREVVEAVIDAMQGLGNALARLDATRKATADVTEEK